LQIPIETRSIQSPSRFAAHGDTHAQQAVEGKDAVVSCLPYNLNITVAEAAP